MKLRHTIAIAGLIGSVNANAALDVYVMDSGEAANNTLVSNALIGAGHSVTLGLPWWQQDGAQSLTNFDAVVFLNNYNWNSPAMPMAGQSEVFNYVENGGGLVTSEWFVWNLGSASRFPALAPLSPAEPTGAFSSAASTTYTQVTPDSIINDGVPASFTFAMDSISGTETALTPVPGATVFYSSSNGGGTPDSGGLVGWEFGTNGGRVASFSTVIGNMELGDLNYEQLFVNSVEWVAPVPEAETWAMLLIGIGMVGVYVKRRNAANIDAISS